ncbi:hypothetical protein H6G74_05635 [Nostoc spongiaeforme FACHB-130]|uniref:Uncharacterized protein n=1 Tax=Nostoc spongiaeforme FACHB-130 TaxID=1357510 RepID=A0ABR8FS93_9NOSO|nr:hypothetical protein [Nostoc spongiaeforme]MBD2593810.1 hypothetical protein [Nostoc spongiaeforme FACHB-130]
MTNPSCSLWIFVARPDTSFILQTIPHLVKVNNFPFEEKVLAIDTASLTGDKLTRPSIGTMKELRECAEKLLRLGVVDRIVDINYDKNYHEQVYKKHFGTQIRFTHNYKGYPILGSAFSIEECKSDYMLHFDSDMLMYQNPNHNWINQAIQLMTENPQMMFVRPLAGPPTAKKKSEPYDIFKTFGSRVYLINCQRFNQLLPLPIIWCKYNKQWMNNLPTQLKTALSNFTGKGKLDSWEVMVTEKLKQTDYFRANLTNPAAWTLHPKDRSPEFIAALPKIIARIEAGDFPAQQAGNYDLIPEAWYKVGSAEKLLLESIST